MNDLKFAFRQLLKNPGFTAVAVLTLALGIGATTAIFSVVNAVLLRPLPYGEPGRLVQMLNSATKGGGADAPWLAVPDIVEIRGLDQVFEHFATYQPRVAIDLSGEEPVGLSGAAISADTFDALGVRPLIGRSFRPEEAVAGRGQVILLSHGYWLERFGGDPGVVGKVVRFKDKSYEVVGVMPAAFGFPETSLVRREARFWVPLVYSDYSLKNRTSFSHQVVARLRSGVSVEQANAALSTLASRLAEQFPQNAQRVFRVVSLHDYLVGAVRPVIRILFGAVCLVLLIACANVANLLLARASVRQREVAIRASLGAGRSRLFRLFLVESGVLAMLGGLLGVLVALWGLEAVRSTLPANVPRMSEIRVNAPVFVFVAGISLLTALLAGIAPAFQYSRPDLTGAIKEGGSFASESSGRLRLRQWLMGFESALAVVLLIGAGLLIKSFWVLQQVKLGFNPKYVLTTGVTPAEGRSGPEQVAVYYERLAERILAIEGIESVGFVDFLPLSGTDASYSFRIEGRGGPQDYDAKLRVVSGDYFQAMQIPLMRGRLLDRNDTGNSPPVVVISQSMSRKFWGDKSPIGQRIIYSGWPAEIVGIVGDVRHSGPEAEADLEMYVPLTQRPALASYLQLVARGQFEPSRLAGAVRHELLALNPTWPVEQITTLDRILAGLTAPRRFNMLLVSVFGGLALALSAVGIYGVVSFSVARRTREIGVRMALGAQKQQVLKLILIQGLTASCSGTAVGLIISVGLARVTRGLLFQVGATDSSTYLIVVLVLVSVSFLASLIPANRAARIDPMEALRYE